MRPLAIAFVMASLTSFSQSTDFQIYTKIDAMSTYQVGYMKSLIDTVVKSKVSLLKLNASDFNVSGTGAVTFDYTNSQKATTSTPGILTDTDWDTFNLKQNALSLTADRLPYATGASTLANGPYWTNSTQSFAAGGAPTNGTLWQIEAKTADTNAGLRATQTSTGSVSLNLVRLGGMTSDWSLYGPSGSSDVRLYSGADRFTFTTAGILTATGQLHAGAGSFSGWSIESSVNISVGGGNTDAVTIKNAGSDGVGFLANRTGGTASNWFMHLPAGQTYLAFQENGNDRFTFTTGGNFTATGSGSQVGLHAVNTGTGEAFLKIERDGGIASEWYIYTPAGLTDLRFFDNAADRFTFTTAGNFIATNAIGIGATPSGDEVLLVQGSSASSVLTRITNTGTGQVELNLNRTVGIPTNWGIYGPEDSDELRFFSGADRFIFTTAGLFTAASLQATGLASGQVVTVTTGGLLTSTSSLSVNNLNGGSGASSSTFWRGDGTWATAGGIGGSTGSTDNAVLRADGTGGVTAQSSALVIEDDGDLLLGLTTTLGSSRSVTPRGTASDITVAIFGKGSGGLQVSDGTGTGNPGLIVQSNLARLLTTDDIQLYSTTALTSTVQYVDIFHSTSGTPANGLGVGFNFLVENSASGMPIIATLESVTTDVTSGSEDADLMMKLRAAGTTAEKFRFGGDGAFYIGPAATNGSWRIIQSGDDLLIQQREAGTYVTKSTIPGA